MKSAYQLNPLSNVIVGFRNYVFEDTRSRYVSFSIKEQPDMCQLLLQIAKGDITDNLLAVSPPHLVQQLIKYGFIKPANTLSVAGKIKQRFNLLNKSRHLFLTYNNVSYIITSFVFMAFNSQKSGKFLRETVVLPQWSNQFADTVFQLLKNGATDQDLGLLPKRTINRLLKHGVIASGKSCIAPDNLLKENYLINDTLLELIPSYSRERLPQLPESEQLLIKNKIYFPKNQRIPQALNDKIYHLDWVERNLPTFWIEDVVSGVISMYWLERDHEMLLKKLVNKTITPENLDARTRQIFTQLYILESPTSFQQRELEWNRIIDIAKRDLAKKQCFTLPDILHPLQLAIVRKYINYILENRYLLPDKANGSTRRRYWRHRDEVTFYIQSQICSVINQILPEPVKIGHNALAVYEPGAVLPKHKDDVLAFSWVMSLAIDTKPEIDREQAWPIYVETQPGQQEAALLRMGDGHAIDPQMPHWRDELKDHRLGILFLWFVPVNYRGYVNGSWIG